MRRRQVPGVGGAGIGVGLAGGVPDCFAGAESVGRNRRRGGNWAAGAPQLATAASEQPRRGGTLTWAASDIIDDINPTSFSGGAAAEILNQVLDGLVVLDANQQVYPHLATRWAIDDDARRYTFTLRDDVHFHDGTPLTADAVKRSWERWLDPRNKAGAELLFLGPIDAIDTPDPRTLNIRFTEPNPLFLLNTWRPYFGPLSPKQLDAIAPGDKITAPIGTGPFKFGGRSADGVVTLDANPDYAWGDDLLANRKAPYVQQLRYRSIIDPSTRVATLESGESLLIDDLPEADYARLAATGRYRFVEAPRTGPALGFFINVQRPPADDLAVRQALNWAVDRQAIVDQLFFKRHPVAVGPLSEGVWSRVDDLEQTFTHDAARAGQILDAAGWTLGSDGIRQKAGQRLTLVLATFRDPWSQIAEAVQSQVRARVSTCRSRRWPADRISTSFVRAATTCVLRRAPISTPTSCARATTRPTSAARTSRS